LVKEVAAGIAEADDQAADRVPVDAVGTSLRMPSI